MIQGCKGEGVEKVMCKRLIMMFKEMVFKRPEIDLQERDFAFMIEEARQEWQSAKKLFEEATDQDLIDHAIHGVKAAERRYMYLLKEAREKNVKIDQDMMIYLPLAARNFKKGQ